MNDHQMTDVDIMLIKMSFFVFVVCSGVSAKFCPFAQTFSFAITCQNRYDSVKVDVINQHLTENHDEIQPGF